GHYADIQVDAEPYNDGVIIRFITKNSWFIGRVAVEGRIKEPPNNGQLVNATRLNLGEPYNEQRLGGAVQGVVQTLEANGFYQSRIEPRTDYDARFQQVHIHFDAAAGRRARFTTPEVIGDPKMPPAGVAAATRWKGWLGWRPVTQSRVQRGIERVRSKYQKQNRLMAAVSIEDLAYDANRRTVTPALSVIAGPIVEIRTIGAKVSRSRLKRYIPAYEESTVDYDLLMEGRRNLRDYFQSQGFFETEVEFKQQRVVNDKAVIDYLINTGPRHRLVNIAIEGNRYFDTETIRERMFMLPRSLQFRHGRYSESLRERDLETISNLYRENGFRDVKVTSVTQDNYNGKRNHLGVVIQIAEGPQWFVAKLNVTGIEQLERERILDLLSSNEGQPFSEFNVAVDRDAILGRYFAEGFNEAAFEWSYKPAERPYQVALSYSIKEGQRRFVRQVITSGLETTDTGLVNRNLLLNPGDPLSQIKMIETQKRLYDLGVFARVNVAIQNPEGETQKKYVLYQMEEARRYSITGGFGAEFGRIGGGRDFESPGGKTGFSPRVSFDVSRLNFRGLGHTVSFRSRISNLQSRALVNYSAPRVRDIPDLNLSFTVLYDDSRD
ncbi:MAG: POTRA domain-containing protein, partial [Blastocatellia bacterium]